VKHSAIVSLIILRIKSKARTQFRNWKRSHCFYEAILSASPVTASFSDKHIHSFDVSKLYTT